MSLTVISSLTSKLNINSSLISEGLLQHGFYNAKIAARWSVLRNFLVIAKTTSKQLSLKLPPAKAGLVALKMRGRRTGIHCGKSQSKLSR